MTAAALRSTLGDGNSRLVVSAYDALTARVAEAAGFEILHVTGFGSAAAITGGPDIGLVTMTEMVETTRRICDAVERPVIADADCGYGNPLNVMRTVRALEAAGAAGLHLEDQVTPKRCGHMAGKAVIPAAEMVAKVAAAVDARDDPDFVIIARTDARAPEGLDAALERAHAYSAAGADVLFVEAPESVEEIQRIATELPGRSCSTGPTKAGPPTSPAAGWRNSASPGSSSPTWRSRSTEPPEGSTSDSRGSTHPMSYATSSPDSTPSTNSSVSETGDARKAGTPPRPMSEKI